MRLATREDPVKNKISVWVGEYNELMNCQVKDELVSQLISLNNKLNLLSPGPVISSAGCALGLAIGWQGSQVIAHRAGLPFVFARSNAWLTLVVSTVMNVCFVLLPAARAAKVSPIRALKYE